MEAFELYLLKSTVALSFLFVFYWLVLRKETFHSLNRVFLLGTLLISGLCPLISFSLQNISTGTFYTLIDPIVVQAQAMANPVSKIAPSLSILSIIYISGAVFFSLRFLSNLVRIQYLYSRFPREKYKGFKAVIMDGDQSAFTFFNILFISRIDFENGKSSEMIVHEQAHRDEYHSIDIILLEIITILQWFNPFIWLFRVALKSEHEFFADSKVLQEGFEKLSYQKLLFEKSLGITSFQLSNAFNYSLLKKRLKMMSINKSNSRLRIKYLMSVPVVFLTILLLAINYNSFAQDDKIYDEVDIMATFQGGGISGVRKYIAENISYPESARKNKVEAKIFVQFVVDEKGEVTDVHAVRSDIIDNVSKEVVVVGYSPTDNPEVNSGSVADLEAEAVRVIKSLNGFTPGQKDGKNVKTQWTFPIQFVLQKEES